MRGMRRLLSSPTIAGSLILQARLRADLTQRELAEKAGTAQSTISAYEQGKKDPAMGSLLRILQAAGFDLRMRLAPHDDHDETLAAWRATLTPEARGRLQRDLAVRTRRAKETMGFG